MKRALMLLVAVVGCKAGPSAAEVCSRLEAQGVATGCKAEAPAGLGAAAAERVTFSLPGKAVGGQVLKFSAASDYDATVKAFDAAAALAGRHRYGSEGAKVFVQLNAETPAELGDKARAVVAGL
jgi:hypothetical protein